MWEHSNEMYYIYIIKSIEWRRFYIGSCEYLQKRLKKHNAGEVRSTKFYRPWGVVYKEEYENRTLARKREIELKKNYQIRKQIIDKLN